MHYLYFKYFLVDPTTTVINVNTFLDRYIRRPPKFEQLTLMEFAKQVSGRGSSYHCARHENIVRVMPNHLEDDKDDCNSNYYRISCLLHLSYRSAVDDLLHNTDAGQCDTWKQLYDYFRLNEKEDDIPDLDMEDIDEDQEVEVLDNEIRKSIFERASSFHPTIQESELGERIIDGFDWNQPAENYPSFSEAKEFLKTYKTSFQPTEDGLSDSAVVFNSEQ